MLKCPYCGRESDDGRDKCSECGTELAAAASAVSGARTQGGLAWLGRGLVIAGILLVLWFGYRAAGLKGAPGNLAHPRGVRLGSAQGRSDSIRTGRLRVHAVEVVYSGISAESARAIGQVLDVARANAVRHFGFDMPELITIRVTAAADRSFELYNDTRSTLTYNLRSEADLAGLGQGNWYMLYGLCHEVGHLAMYRLLPLGRTSWLKWEGQESWARYSGSRLADLGYAECASFAGGALPGATEQRMKREREMAENSLLPRDERQLADLWDELADIIGDQGIAPLFSTWNRLNVDAAHPVASVAAELGKEREADRLTAWWAKAGPRFTAEEDNRLAAQLAHDPFELSSDNGQLAESVGLEHDGHAVRFEVVGTNAFLTAVSVCGCRYGPARGAYEQFWVWLCDRNGKTLAGFRFAYSLFPAGAPGRWVRLPIRPTRVPEEFLIVVSFESSRVKGVQVYHDGMPSRQSFTGMPGVAIRPFSKGNWLIRAELDRCKSG